MVDNFKKSSLKILMLAIVLVIMACTQLPERSSEAQRAAATDAVAPAPVASAKVESPSQSETPDKTEAGKVETTTLAGNETSVEDNSQDEKGEEKQDEKADEKNEAQSQIPVEINQNVEKWIEYFTKTDRERFQRFLNRGEKYREVVENVLFENDLPPELYYLAMIESGYQTDAHSKAKAAGVWQFMTATAKRYGLRVDRSIDERRDPIRATEAAARYLRDLYNVFGSWHLAMAAYNAGEIRVLRAVFKGRTRDFWELVDAKVLPRETAEYVPKFLAVVKIGSDPKKYGFDLEESAESYPELESISVPASISLSDLAGKIDVAKDLLEKINPQILGGKIPYGGGEVWVPEKKASGAQTVADQLHETKKPIKGKKSSRRSIASVPEDSKDHIVKSGETLGKIAAQYKISVGHLKRMNALHSSKIRPGMKLHTQVKKYVSPNFIRYKVKRGDSLTLIARRFKTSIRKIKKTNELLSNKVVTGQTLRIQATRVDEDI